MKLENDSVVPNVSIGKFKLNITKELVLDMLNGDLKHDIEDDIQVYDTYELNNEIGILVGLKEEMQ